MATALIVNLLVVLALAAGMSLASPLFGPRRTLPREKGLPYETGMPPFGAPYGRMTASYWRFAVLFVVFDVDLAFLVPWVLLRRHLTFEAMVSMSAFLLLIGLTLAYLWRKGALECD
ncbi:MAG TPA: NADH-quinone oxidoreductase subunit A [Elusimicrobia bacterium]|nr:NADH-quinone oxidoreductase subunit A [Elusimicrobiota bacterium]